MGAQVVWHHKTGCIRSISICNSRNTLNAFARHHHKPGCPLIGSVIAMLQWDSSFFLTVFEFQPISHQRLSNRKIKRLIDVYRFVGIHDYTAKSDSSTFSILLRINTGNRTSDLKNKITQKQNFYLREMGSTERKNLLT